MDVISLVSGANPPANAQQMVTDATAAQVAAQQVVTDAKSMPTSDEIKQYAAAAAQVAQEVIVILQQFHVFGAAEIKPLNLKATPMDIDVQAALYQLRLRQKANQRPPS
jgi:hypothetical protein